MNHQAATLINQSKGVYLHNNNFLQRKCTCGNHASATQCEECKNKSQIGLQAKLKINQPGDKYEQEADRVADQIMRMPDPQLDGSEEEAIDFASVPAIQRLKENAQGTQNVEAPPIVSEVLNSSGQPLDQATRDFMEPRFGQDFSHVRIHTDQKAAESAKTVNALAYTVGNDIVFGADGYSSKQLLAHELTHFIQQQNKQFEQPAASHSNNVLMPYRSKNSANFGACDTGSLKEKSFSSKKKDPWIEFITINFNETLNDSDGDLVPKGQLSTKYFDNESDRPSVITNLSVVGGAASEGLTDRGNHTVRRIEGCGYDATFTPIPRKERLKGHKRGHKYFKPSLANKANMSFAVFFVGKQAIHQGSLDSGSLACVHVGDTNKMQQINYHSVLRKTKVKVSYASSILKDLCCERYKHKGWMVSNPCKGQDPKECDKDAGGK